VIIARSDDLERGQKDAAKIADCVEEKKKKELANFVPTLLSRDGKRFGRGSRAVVLPEKVYLQKKREGPSTNYRRPREEMSFCMPHTISVCEKTSRNDLPSRAARNS